jgi:hypothetical protein
MIAGMLPGAFHDGAMRAREGAKAGSQRAAVGRQVGPSHHAASGIDGVEGDRALVQVNSGEQRGGSQRGSATRMPSLGLAGDTRGYSPAGGAAAAAVGDRFEA